METDNKGTKETWTQKLAPQLINKPTARAIREHQNPTILLQWVLDIPTRLKLKRITLKPLFMKLIEVPKEELNKLCKEIQENKNKWLEETLNTSFNKFKNMFQDQAEPLWTPRDWITEELDNTRTQLYCTYIADEQLGPHAGPPTTGARPTLEQQWEEMIWCHNWLQVYEEFHVLGFFLFLHLSNSKVVIIVINIKTNESLN